MMSPQMVLQVAGCSCRSVLGARLRRTQGTFAQLVLDLLGEASIDKAGLTHIEG